MRITNEQEQRNEDEEERTIQRDKDGERTDVAEEERRNAVDEERVQRGDFAVGATGHEFSEATLQSERQGETTERE